MAPKLNVNTNELPKNTPLTAQFNAEAMMVSVQMVIQFFFIEIDNSWNKGI